MSIKVKSGGAYADITGVFHKRAGAYEAVHGVYHKAGGVYGRVGGGGAAPTEFRYWRLLMSANDGNADYWSMSRLSLLDGETNLSYPQRATATDNTNIGVLETAMSCFNDSLSDEWVGLKAVTPSWVAIDLGSAVALTSYYISSQRGTTGRTPSAWTLQGSNDSQTGPWTDVDTRSGETAWAIQETRNFSIGA